MPDEEVRAAIERLLAQRQPGATICPSEVAREVAPHAWRPLMPQVRTVAQSMAQERVLEIRQGGRALPPGATLRGPIRLARTNAETAGYPTTPDGRYFVVRGRLSRKANPQLPVDVRDALVKELMDARRALRGTRLEAERRAAREQVDRAKRALGERGPVWWTDGAPDFNRKMAKNTPYAEWYAKLPAD